MKHKVKRYNEGELVGEAVGDSNEGMKEARDAYDASQAEEASKAKEAAEDMRERAKAEGARDAGKITESGDQGFGGAGSSRTVKATPKAPSKPKADPKPAAKSESKPAAKAAPVDMTKLSANERTKRTIEKNLSGARSGSGPTDTRSVTQRLRSAFGMRSGGSTAKMASGGMTSSASKRADGIASKGKTRGKMV
jgi:hypothetical protein